jgi:hypothetical protein
MQFHKSISWYIGLLLIGSALEGCAPKGEPFGDSRQADVMNKAAIIRESKGIPLTATQVEAMLGKPEKSVTLKQFSEEYGKENRATAELFASYVADGMGGMPNVQHVEVWLYHWSQPAVYRSYISICLAGYGLAGR